MYIFYIHTTDSTQNQAKALANLHSVGVPFWVQSATQTQGRGQRGRSWVSEPGNLFLTGCFTAPEIVPGQISIKIGVWLANILKASLSDHRAKLSRVGLGAGPTIGIKWPNDLLINGQKCGGVLIEMAENLYIGIGINLTSHPSDTAMPATHLHAYLQPDAQLDAPIAEYLVKEGLVKEGSVKKWLVGKITEIIDVEFLTIKDFGSYQQLWWDFAEDSILFWRLPESVAGQVIGIDRLGQLLIQASDGKITARHQTFAEQATLVPDAIEAFQNQ